MGAATSHAPTSSSTRLEEFYQAFTDHLLRTLRKKDAWECIELVLA